MKTIAVLLVLVALVLAAGCTTGQPAAPQNFTVQTTAATPVTTDTPAVPPDLARTWTLTLMAARNGSDLMRPTGDVTITFFPQGELAGYSGCNNYNAPFTLGAETTPKGNAIRVGPIVSTLKFCDIVAGQETTYYGILQEATAYAVNRDELTITAADGTALVFRIK